MQTEQLSKNVKALDTIKIPKRIDMKAVEAFRKEAVKTFELAQAMQVIDLTTKNTAEALAKACSDFIKKVKAHYKPELDKRDEAKRQATAEKKELTDYIDAITNIIKDGMNLADGKARAWTDAENRRIEEENRKKLIEAQKKAEEEKKKEIQELKEVGTPEARQAARELKAEPTTAAPVQLQEKVGSTSGTIHRQLWKAATVHADERKSLKALVEAAAKDFEKFGKFLNVNWPALNTEATNAKERFAVPGFKAYNKGSTAHL